MNSQPQPDAPRRPLRGPIAFLIALITGAIGCVLGLFAGNYLTRLYHVSDMEGGRGYAVVFLFAPLGIIIGFVVGLIVALRTRWSGFVGFAKTQGLSIVVTVAIAGIASGLAWLGADKPPKIGGKNLVLEFELKVSPSVPMPPELSQYSIRASLYANNRDNRYAEIDIGAISKRDGSTIVPGSAALMSRSANRSLLAHIGEGVSVSQFIELNGLPAAPGKQNANWSDWIVATQHADLTPVAENERIAVRYRVRPAGD